MPLAAPVTHPPLLEGDCLTSGEFLSRWEAMPDVKHAEPEPGTDGIFRCACFPGLWLETAALWDLDLPRINAVLQQGLATPEHAEFAAPLATRKG